MDREYVLRISREDRVGAPYRAQLIRPALGDPSSMTPVVDVEDLGIAELFELLANELIDYREDHGELP